MTPEQELAAYRREAKMIGIIAGVLRGRSDGPCTEVSFTEGAYELVAALGRAGLCIIEARDDE
jgi:hypothetical protein